MAVLTLGGDLRTEFNDGGDAGRGRAGGEALGSLAAAEAAVGAFCGRFDAGVVTASEAAEVVARVAVVSRRLEAVAAHAARRVDTSGVWKHRGYRSAAQWLATTSGDPVGATMGLLATASTLEAVPATAEAFAAGSVSAAAAREIAGAVAVDPGAEATLLAVAAGGDHRGLVDAAAAVRQAARSAEDEATRHARLRARRYARTRTDADGLVVLHAGFAPKDWAPFASMWQRATDTEFTRARRHGRRDTPDAYAADALLALLATGSTDPPAAPDATGPPDRQPGMKAEVVVLVDGIALKRGHVSSGERCEILGVGPVDINWVQQLLPTAIVHVLVHDGVDITTYASATRAIRKAVRLAVTARDRTCVVQGRHQQRHVQQDHRHDYARGGAGSADNLNLLCQFHHNQKTRDGARLERIDDHWHWYPPGHTTAWISPVGATLTLWDTDTS